MLLECCRVFLGKVKNVEDKKFANAAEPTDVAVLSMLQMLQWP